MNIAILLKLQVFSKCTRTGIDLMKILKNALLDFKLRIKVKKKERKEKKCTVRLDLTTQLEETLKRVAVAKFIFNCSQPRPINTWCAIRVIFSFILDFELVSGPLECKIFNSIRVSIWRCKCLMRMCIPLFVLYFLLMNDNNNNNDDNNNNNDDNNNDNNNNNNNYYYFFILEAFL